MLADRVVFCAHMYMIVIWGWYTSFMSVLLRMICRWVRLVIPLITQQICFAPFGFLYYRPLSRRCMGTEHTSKLNDRFHRLLRTVFASTFAASKVDHAIWYRIPCPVYNIVKFFFANTRSIIPENQGIQVTKKHRTKSSPRFFLHQWSCLPRPLPPLRYNARQQAVQINITSTSSLFSLSNGILWSTVRHRTYKHPAPVVVVQEKKNNQREKDGGWFQMM